MEERIDTTICLIGFMGTGKSTVSKKLAELTGMQEVDLDEVVVCRAGKSIKQIFEQEGEEAFREMESVCLREVMDVNGRIVSCGGGTVIKKENVEMMRKKGVIILLTAAPQTVFERVKRGKDRPVLNGNMRVEYIAQLMEKRRSYYEDAADITIVTDDKTVDNIAQEIVSAVRQRQL